MYKIAPLNGWLWNAFRLNESVNALDADKMKALTNVVAINTEADFPIQDATTITLSPNTGYLLGGLVTTAKRFIVGANVTLTSAVLTATTLVYTGTGNMFTATSGNFAIVDTIFSCPSGTVFNCSGVGILILERSTCNACVNVGTVTGGGVESLNWTNCAFPSISSQGLQFFGSFFVNSFTKIFMSSTSPSFVGVDLGSAVFYNVEIENIELFGVSGSVGIKGHCSQCWCHCLYYHSNLLLGIITKINNSYI